MHKPSTGKQVPDGKGVRGLNLRHLGWHQLYLGSAFVVLQAYIAQEREKGILIIVAMLLMNASSPFGHATLVLDQTSAQIENERSKL